MDHGHTYKSCSRILGMHQALARLVEHSVWKGEMKDGEAVLEVPTFVAERKEKKTRINLIQKTQGSCHIYNPPSILVPCRPKQHLNGSLIWRKQPFWRVGRG